MASATRITVSSFGALVGVAGIEHGIGEILQGNVAPNAFMFLSWPGEGPFSILGGEPAMTIVPNLFVAGIITVLLSSAFIFWAIRFIGSKHGGLVLVLLSIAMLIAGGGIFPPVFGIILGAVGTRIPVRRNGERNRLVGLQNYAAKLWPWSLGLGLSAWLFMLPVLPLLAYFFGLPHDAGLVSSLALCMIGFMFSTIFTGFARDGLSQAENRVRADSPQAVIVS